LSWINGITIFMPSRYRLVVPISLQPADKVQLDQLRLQFTKLRATKVVSASEAVRFALSIAAAAPAALVAQVVRDATRVPLGRPHLPWARQSWQDDDFEKEEAQQRERLNLVHELEHLQRLPSRTDEQEARLEEICKAFNMVLQQDIKET
jgi:hypothetical protein